MRRRSRTLIRCAAAAPLLLALAACDGDLITSDAGETPADAPASDAGSIDAGPETTTTYSWSPRTRPLFVRVAAGALPATVAFTTTFRTT